MGGKGECQLNVVKVKLDDLKPDPRNARKHNERNIEAIKKSLEQNPQYRPFVVQRSTGIVLVGNGMLQAMREMGMTEGWAEYRDLDDAQAAKLALTDNRTGDLAEWDEDVLKSVMVDLGGEDADIAGWDGEEIASFIDPPEADNYATRTNEIYNLDTYDAKRTAGFYQMPIVKKCNVRPTDLVGFNLVLSMPEKERRAPGLGVHFFIDDYQFERIWNQPDRYMDALSQFSCVLEPNFSLYFDMPMAMKIWNIYRTRFIGQMMQDYGINVIPTLCWAEEETLKFALDGIEPGGTVAVSTVSMLKDKKLRADFTSQLGEVLKRLTPSFVVLYGNRKFDYDFPCDSVYIENSITKRMNEMKKKKGGEKHGEGIPSEA